ncbi:MAG: ABC transporter ATP-binding protein [Pseudomonadota bacterium]
MLELKTVSKRVSEATHIDSVSMTMAPGSLNVLLGPTLSGKTSLMRLMAGLDRPTSGEVWVDGINVTGLPVQKRDVAMVYQQFINYPAMSVYDNIASPMRIAKMSRAEIDDTVERVATLLQLKPYLKRLPLELSGGQQQRTALARALAKNAKLVLLDEPLANLDYKLREELRAELPRIFSQSGAVFVYATAEPEEALLLGGRTATLHEGRVTQFDDTVTLYRSPADLVTAKTFSDPPLNVIGAVKQGDQFRAAGLALRVPDKFKNLLDGPYIIAFRPHHLSLASEASGNTIPLQISVTEITGSESFLHATIGGEDWVVLEHGVHDPAPGTTVNVAPKLDQMLVFNRLGEAVTPSTLRRAA